MLQVQPGHMPFVAASSFDEADLFVPYDTLRSVAPVTRPSTEIIGQVYITSQPCPNVG